MNNDGQHIHCIHRAAVAHLSRGVYRCCRCKSEYEQMPTWGAALADETVKD